MSTRLVTVERLERAEHHSVQPDAAGRRQLLVERVPDENVRKAQMARTPRNVRDDALEHCFVEGVEQIVVRDPGDGSERINGELASEYRCENEHPPGLFGETAHSSGNDISDGLRNREAGRLLVMKPPSATSRRTISPRKSGLPSVSSETAATSSALGASPVVSSK